MFQDLVVPCANSFAPFWDFPNFFNFVLRKLGFLAYLCILPCPFSCFFQSLRQSSNHSFPAYSRRTSFLGGLAEASSPAPLPFFPPPLTPTGFCPPDVPPFFLRRQNRLLSLQLLGGRGAEQQTFFPPPVLSPLLSCLPFIPHPFLPNFSLRFIWGTVPTGPFNAPPACSRIRSRAQVPLCGIAPPRPLVSFLVPFSCPFCVCSPLRT